MKEIALSLFELCDYAMISNNNKFSLIGLFDQIYTQRLPSKHGKMFIVGIANGESNSEHKIKFVIKNPLGKNIFPNIELDLKLGLNGKSNLLAELTDLPLETSGIYTIECVEGNKIIGSKKLTVHSVSGGYGKTEGARRSN